MLKARKYVETAVTEEHCKYNELFKNLDVNAIIENETTTTKKRFVCLQCTPPLYKYEITSLPDIHFGEQFGRSCICCIASVTTTNYRPFRTWSCIGDSHTYRL